MVDVESLDCGNEEKFLYLIVSSIGMIKIGIAVNPSKRAFRLGLGTGIDHKVVASTVSPFSYRKMQGVEDNLRSNMSGIRKYGDWFLTDYSSAIKAFKDCVDSMGLDSFLFMDSLEVDRFVNESGIFVSGCDSSCKYTHHRMQKLKM